MLLVIASIVPTVVECTVESNAHQDHSPGEEPEVQAGQLPSALVGYRRTACTTSSASSSAMYEALVLVEKRIKTRAVVDRVRPVKVFPTTAVLPSATGASEPIGLEVSADAEVFAALEEDDEDATADATGTAWGADVDAVAVGSAAAADVLVASGSVA